MNFVQNMPTKIFCDNKSILALAKNPIFHCQSKHIDVRFHFLRELVNEKVVEIVFCKTEDQVADIFTKALKKETFLKLRRLLGMCTNENSVKGGVLKSKPNLPTRANHAPTRSLAN